MMAQVGAVVEVASFMDRVAESDGKGGGYVTGEVEAAARAKAAQLSGVVSVAAGAALAWWLSENMPGVRLDSDEPFSDASLSGALSAALGVSVASIKDRAALKSAFSEAAAKKLSDKTGVVFRNVFDREILRQDVMTAAGVHVGNVVPGLSFTDLSSRAAVRADFVRYAVKMAAEVTGIPFGDLSTAAEIRESMYTWAMPFVEAEIAQEPDISAGAAGLKMDRAHIRHRQAQRAYRERMRGRIVYVPLG